MVATNSLARRYRPTGAAFVMRSGRPARSANAINAVGMVGLGVILALASYTWPALVPWSVYAPLIALAGVFLPPRWLALTFATFLVEIVANEVLTQGWVPNLHTLVALGSLMLTMALMLWLSRSRSRLGVQGNSGEDMLVDLRDRLRAYGELPDLPRYWHAETAVESAYGESFSGDFVIANRSTDGRLLEVALVDVSGKGARAGTRALLLSGALGGLLGEMEPEKFLAAANSYLLRQRWDEGFATAIHVSLDLATAEFTIGTAGHPPAVQFAAGSGRWAILDDTAGPLLGVIENAAFPRTSGRLLRGDALVLYTDGVIETRHRDLTVGVDRMLGTAERLVPQGFVGAAARICATAKAGETDDRAVVMIWRD